MAFKNVQAVGQRAEIKIDVDGSGPLAPFPVTCEFYANGKVGTVLHHSNEETTPVDGFQGPGSFIQDIHYEADDDQIAALINRSTSCRQHIQYACRVSIFIKLVDFYSVCPISYSQFMNVFYLYLFIHTV